MTNPTPSQIIQSFLRALGRALTGTLLSGEPAVVCQKAPPRLSLAQSFVDQPVRRNSPNLAWFEGGR